MHKLDEKALAAALEALKPFADAAAGYDRPDIDYRGVMHHEDEEWAEDIVVGDLRRARDAFNLLAALPPEQSAAQQPATDAVATHRHRKRGSAYTLIGIGKMQTENWYDCAGSSEGRSFEPVDVDMREVAIYRSVDDGQLWVRPVDEFWDGRFEALSQSPSKPAGGSTDENH